MDISSIYPFIVVSSLAIGLSIALNEWRHGDNVECRRISATFGVVLVLQTPYLLWDFDALFPVFRPFVDTVSLILDPLDLCATLFRPGKNCADSQSVADPDIRRRDCHVSVVAEHSPAEPLGHLCRSLVYGRMASWCKWGWPAWARGR